MVKEYTKDCPRGGERVTMKIKDRMDMSFYVSSISNVITDSKTENFILNLCSREAITNETARVPIKFPTSSPISSFLLNK